MGRPRKTAATPKVEDKSVELLTQLSNLINSLSNEDKQKLAQISQLNKSEPIPAKLKETNNKTTTRRGANIPLGKRVNTFETSAIFKQQKEDSKIDKALWGKNKPTSRGERTTLVQSYCSKCDKEEMVSASISLLKEDEEGNKRLEHVCDSCLSNSKTSSKKR